MNKWLGRRKVAAIGVDVTPFLIYLGLLAFLIVQDIQCPNRPLHISESVICNWGTSAIVWGIIGGVVMLIWTIEWFEYSSCTFSKRYKLWQWVKNGKRKEYSMSRGWRKFARVLYWIVPMPAWAGILWTLVIVSGHSLLTLFWLTWCGPFILTGLICLPKEVNQWVNEAKGKEQEVNKRLRWRKLVRVFLFSGGISIAFSLFVTGFYVNDLWKPLMWTLATIVAIVQVVLWGYCTATNDWVNKAKEIDNPVNYNRLHQDCDTGEASIKGDNIMSTSLVLNDTKLQKHIDTVRQLKEAINTKVAALAERLMAVGLYTQQNLVQIQNCKFSIIMDATNQTVSFYVKPIRKGFKRLSWQDTIADLSDIGLSGKMGNTITSLPWRNVASYKVNDMFHVTDQNFPHNSIKLIPLAIMLADEQLENLHSAAKADIAYLGIEND